VRERPIEAVPTGVPAPTSHAEPTRHGGVRPNTAHAFAAEVEQLYRVDGARLWRAVFAFSASRVVSDDAVAEAFAQLLRRGTAVEHPRAWVWRTAFRIARGLLKDQRRTVNQLVIDLSYEQCDDVLDVLQLLNGLSDAQRAALVLHHYAGYRAREVAEIIGSTEAAVRVHLMRARRRVRAQLADT
jgi:RNA polymerase sigma-70 factor, ECF subfamily